MSRLERPWTPEEVEAEKQRIRTENEEAARSFATQLAEERASLTKRQAKAEDILKQHGIELRLSESWVGECSKVRMVYQGEVILDDEEAQIDTGALDETSRPWVLADLTPEDRARIARGFYEHGLRLTQQMQEWDAQMEAAPHSADVPAHARDTA